MAKSAAERMREYRARNKVKQGIVTCKNCGRLFRPQRTTAKFCKPACRVSHHRSSARGLA